MTANSPTPCIGASRRIPDRARRLHGAIGWLDLAWRNAASITVDLRIPAIRSGFEVLFDTGGTQKLYRALSALLDADDAPRTHRSWRDFRQDRKDDLTELQWWFVCFTLLRNAIAHGSVVPPGQHQYEGRSHTDLGMHRLCEAIKATVIANGFSELALTPHERHEYRVLRKYRLSAPCDAPGEDDP